MLEILLDIEQLALLELTDYQFPLQEQALKQVQTYLEQILLMQML
jgi:hypothetical protein